MKLPYENNLSFLQKYRFYEAVFIIYPILFTKLKIKIVNNKIKRKVRKGNRKVHKEIESLRALRNT